SGSLGTGPGADASCKPLIGPGADASCPLVDAPGADGSCPLLIGPGEHASCPLAAGPRRDDSCPWTPPGAPSIETRTAARAARAGHGPLRVTCSLQTLASGGPIGRSPLEMKPRLPVARRRLRWRLPGGPPMFRDPRNRFGDPVVGQPQVRRE